MREVAGGVEAHTPALLLLEVDVGLPLIQPDANRVQLSLQQILHNQNVNFSNENSCGGKGGQKSPLMLSSVSDGSDPQLPVWSKGSVYKNCITDLNTNR